jgi:DNA-binding response OmpR family regulator
LGVLRACLGQTQAGRFTPVADFGVFPDPIRAKIRRLKTDHSQVSTILIIEENANTASLVRTAFDKLDGCDAFVCRNNSEAKAYLLGAGMYKDRVKYPFPRAIVSDPGSNDNPGLDLLRWVKSESSCANLPVYVLSSRSNVDEALAKELGAAKVFKKPVATEELQDLLSDLAMKLCA